jgi:signal transduction histidine kinase
MIGPDKQYYGRIWFFRDVTESKHAQNAISERARTDAFGAEVGRALVEQAPLRDILQSCCESAVKHLEGSFARIWVFNEKEQVLELQASAGLYTHIDGQHGRVGMGQFKIGRIAQTRLPHLTNQVVGDPQVGDQEWARREGMAAFAGYPLLMEDRLIGVMAMFAQHPFSDLTLQAMAVVAYSIAVGIERKHVEESVRRLNESLEARVRDRTAQFEVSNKELETFAYSVSHDLRGPLRAIDGFSQSLLEDAKGKLDKNMTEDLTRIRKAAQRMSRLIDSLLTLSRTTRREMTTEKVDLSLIAGDVASDLQKSDPSRPAEFVITPGLVVNGDRQLLHLALQNLLNNAWKFTRNGKRALIEFGVQSKDGKQVFFVRDNGAGFDMAYADKLFGAFQRLHTEKEFEGTGIGLATVQRIIHRHGGKVWAEGVVGAGATFYFTI